MDATRTLLFGTLVAAALAAPAARAAQEDADRAQARVQVSAEVLGRCDVGTAPDPTVRCNRGVHFALQAPAVEQVLDPASGEAQTVVVKQIDF